MVCMCVRLEGDLQKQMCSGTNSSMTPGHEMEGNEGTSHVHTAVGRKGLYGNLLTEKKRGRHNMHGFIAGP